MKNRRWKKIIAFILAIIMALNTCPELLVRAENVYEEVTLYDLEEKKQEFLTEETSTEGEEGMVTFPLTGAAMKLGEEAVFHVFRQGNTDKEQTVTFATVDLSAAYGKDYELIVDGDVVDGKENVLLDGKNITYDIYMDGSEQTDPADQSAVVEEALSEEEIEQLKDETISSKFSLTFAEGEQIKEIRIRAKRPANTTVDKQFQIVVLECPEDMTVGENATVVVSLCETREIEESEIEIVENSIQVEDGYVTVLVKRTGNTEGYESYEISAEDGTAVNGEDYILKSGQLIFTPGVKKQRIHIPLVSSDKKETKNFTVKAADSEATVTYQTMVTSTSAFKTSREYVNVPWNEFTVQGNNLGAYEFYRQDDNERYILAADSGIGDGDCRTLSIRSGEKYDFTGIKGIRFSASYAIGTVAGDFLNIYASNEDFYNSTVQLDSIADSDKKYGESYGVTSLDGQALLTAAVDRTGEYFIYVTMQQHTVLGGHIEYNLYDQEFDGDKKGHLALMKEDYTLMLLGPDSLGTTVPAGDCKLTLNTDSSVSGDSVTAYRDESFTLSYNLMDSGAVYAGYEIVDKDDKVIYTKETTDPVFVLSSDILKVCKGRLHDDVIKIRPIFERRKAEVSVVKQDFASLEMDSVTASIDEAAGKAVFYDNGDVITTVTWNVSEYESGSSIEFEAEDNPEYIGNYHMTAYKVAAGNSPDFGSVNPLYYMGKECKLTIEEAYYEITPMISNINANFYLNVTGATHGTFTGEPEGQSSDTYTMKEYNGKYEPTDIAIFTAEPDDGYRAKWSYRDIATGETKVYYGNTFYYRVQFPTLSTDNYVNLEFEKNSSQKEYSISASVYMQAGDVLHANANQDLYHPLENCQVTVEKMAGQTDEAGKTVLSGNQNTVMGAADEIHTALLLANNRYYIEEIDFSNASDGNVHQEMKLAYYYEGPYVTDIRYIDYDGVSQNGDTIFLDGETDGCILAAKVENKNKEITDVVFKIKDSNGSQKGDAFTAERNGDEYIWSAMLGMMAEEGDQIWIELLTKEYDENGTLIKQVSYGEVNTGYEIVIAEFSEASYLPDIGIPEFREDNLRTSRGSDVANKIFSGFGFLFSFKGVTPTFNTSKSGNVTYLNLGAVWTIGGKIGSENASVIHWNDWVKYVETGLSFESSEGTARREAARQTLKKNHITASIPVSAQVVFYSYKDEETEKEKLVAIGGGISVGANIAYTFSYPFLFAYTVPMFVTTKFSFSFTDSLQFGPAGENGYVNYANISDAEEFDYTGNNKLNVTVGLTASVGVGVNGIASVSGGANGSLNFNFVSFLVGNGTAKLAGEIRLEAIIAAKTFTIDSVETELFNNIPVTQDQRQQAGNSEDVNTLILEEKLDQLGFRAMSDYHQNLKLSDGEMLIEDAYEFSRPKIYAMGEEKYIIVTTVDSQYVSDCTEEGRPVLSYAIYDKDQFIAQDDGKVFRSIEPEQINENSINYNPEVVEISDGKYMIIWNSIFYNKEEELKLRNMRSVIRSAVLDLNQDEITYNSLVVTDEEGETLHAGVVTNAVYDKKNEEVVILYRVMNLEGLNENSTIADYGKAGTTLCATSLRVDEKSLKDKDNVWTDNISIVKGGGGQVIKNVDLAMMNDVPVISYNKVQGEDVTIYHEGGSETNHIILTSLGHTDSGYTKELEKELEIDTTKYNAVPQLVSGSVEGKELNLIMWKQDNRVAAANVTDILQGDVGDTTGLAVINQETAGNMDDINLFTGEDGKIYSMWSERTEEGSRMMMSVLEEHGESVSWGHGAEVFTTEGKNYIMSISPVVDENGNLKVIYRQTDMSDESGYSEIILRSEELKAKAEISDQLKVSNTVPKAGEVITVTAQVSNTGVGVLSGKTLTLKEDGKDTGITAEVPALAAGETANVEFQYTVPEEVSERGAVLSVGNARQAVSSEAVLNLEDLVFEEQNIANEGEASEYKVTAQVSNTGNTVAQNITAVLSHIDYVTDENNNDEVVETVFATAAVAAIRPNMTMPVSFDVSIPEEMFQTTEIFKLAPVNLALYENYGTENQRMLAGVKDYAEATLEPEVEEMVAGERQALGVGQRSNLRVKITPEIAQIFAGLTYESSDESIATVDANGILTGIKEGTCEITVVAKNGKQVTVKVVVQKDAVEEEDPAEPILPNDEPLNDQTNDPENDKSDHQTGEKTDSSDTGDDTKAGLWLLVFLLSAGSIGMIWYRKKKMNP